MKNNFAFLFMSCLLIGCAGKNSNKEAISHEIVVQKEIAPVCTENYDTLLVSYVSKFKAMDINLDKSISENMNSFLLAVDTNCLRAQKEYNFFITGILAKLYYYHLVCCHTSFDLLSMNTKGAGVIINEYQRIAGYDVNEHIEFLNSGKVVDLINRDSSLNSNKIIRSILLNIKKAESDIEAQWK